MPHVAASPPQFRSGLERLASRAPFRFAPDELPAQFRAAAVLVPFWEQQGEVHVLLGRLEDVWSGAGSHLVPVVCWLSEPPRGEAQG